MVIFSECLKRKKIKGSEEGGFVKFNKVGQLRWRRIWTLSEVNKTRLKFENIIFFQVKKEKRISCRFPWHESSGVIVETLIHARGTHVSPAERDLYQLFSCTSPLRPSTAGTTQHWRECRNSKGKLDEMSKLFHISWDVSWGQYGDYTLSLTNVAAKPTSRQLSVAAFAGFLIITSPYPFKFSTTHLTPPNKEG